MFQSVNIVAYLALFASAGVIFLFINLLVGKFVRPSDPHPEKQEIYECGEPTIGSSFVQFDLRFYVVALVFIIFDVEVAFLFPWATVFGKSVSLMDSRLPVVETLDDGSLALTADAQGLLRELGTPDPSVPKTDAAGESITSAAQASDVIRADARQLVWFSMGAISIFFAVLLVGFAYEWKTGALDWVRAVSQEKRAQVERAMAGEPVEEEGILSA